MVHLQMEYIKQDIQDATFYYLISTHIPDTNLLNTADDTIKYIGGFIQTHHSYSEPQTTQDHLTTDLRAEALSTTTATVTVIASNTGISTSTLSNSYEESSTLLLTHTTDKPW